MISLELFTASVVEFMLEVALFLVVGVAAIVTTLFVIFGGLFLWEIIADLFKKG